MIRQDVSRGITVLEDCIVFGNLVSQGATIGSSSTVTAALPNPSEAVSHKNAPGDLRSLGGVNDAGRLGGEAARKLMAILSK